MVNIQKERKRIIKYLKNTLKKETKFSLRKPLKPFKKLLKHKKCGFKMSKWNFNA